MYPLVIPSFFCRLRSTMKFDDFLATVGDWGKFQKVKYTLICLTYMLPPIMVYTYTFTAATPDFRCQTPGLISDNLYDAQSNDLFITRYQPTKEQCNAEQKHLSLKECQRCFTQRNNSSQSDRKLEECHEYIFDKTHYTKTLVEEVKIIWIKYSYISHSIF